MAWGDKGEEFRPDLCEHPAGVGGCMWCCVRCNHDSHFCGGCGTIVNHGENACLECKTLYS